MAIALAKFIGGFIRWLLKGCRTSLKDETGGNLDASWGGDYDTENYIIGVITVVIVLGGINSGYSFKQKPTDGCKRIPPLRRI